MCAGSLCTFVTEIVIVSANGEVITCSHHEQPDIFQAARLSLGAIGVITQVSRIMRITCA